MRILLTLPLLLLPLTAHAQDKLPKNPGKEALAVPPAGSPGDSPTVAATAADATIGALMDRIEAAVALPAGAQPLTGYARYYAWADPNRTKVAAVYVAGEGMRGWVRFDDLPDIATMESGCRALALIYDVASGRVDEVGCALGA